MCAGAGRETGVLTDDRWYCRGSGRGRSTRVVVEGLVGLVWLVLAGVPNKRVAASSC